ncbi:hypothetical protein [Dictyobacter kobayashii]|uniref:Uncharacterized protein n=1 Tax=Dictyobacter kobayashii TaxID=2014872 RepID=A0A402AQE0_9CHLR|nr:hypothetical protein [Dictyobacter kobayashii]GCE21249.1 hypothetical protein KDK_50490 [Dictyobacter kobayashii]
MQTEAPFLPQTPPSWDGQKNQRKRRKRISPLGLIGTIVTLVVLLGAGTFIFILPRIMSHAANAQPNMDCTLIVPANPLSAQGLATPYQLVATNPNNGPCNESNAAQSAFVQGVIYDPGGGTFSVYNPLVIDKGTQPALAPMQPRLPAGSIVALWFGFNGNNLSLRGRNDDALGQGRCVNGQNRSIFGQFAYCNAPAFFGAVNQGIVAQRVKVPALGVAKDGKPCPTVRDFSVIDQDQSDNVQTRYLATGNGQVAQFSAANQAQLQNATVVANPSDNALLTNFLDPALGCKSWTAPNLADNGAPASALPLDELQASVYQAKPIALVPSTDPMTMVSQGKQTVQSLDKTNLYRRGVDQIPATNDQQASGAQYCQDMVTTGLPRLQLDKQLTIGAGTPDPAAANNLFTFLAQRFQGSYDNLNCPQLLKMANPVTTQKDGNGVVTSATFNMTPPPPVTNPLNCVVNGQQVAGCTGSATLNGVTCTFSTQNNTVVINCPRNHMVPQQR